MSPRRLLRSVGPAVLVIALVIAVIWGLYSPDFEPTVTALALLGSLLAVILDSRLAERERRRQMLRVLVHEMFMNLSVVKELRTFSRPEKVMKVNLYPRFYTTSLTAAISSGQFVEARDDELWKLMHSWLQRASECNNALALTELQVSSDPARAENLNKKVSESAVTRKASDVCCALAQHLIGRYEPETSIASDTMLFEIKKAREGNA